LVIACGEEAVAVDDHDLVVNLTQRVNDCEIWSRKRGAQDPASVEKLRRFIFKERPQPFEPAVFAQDITGAPLRQQ
jgi:hypothetical protein